MLGWKRGGDEFGVGPESGLTDRLIARFMGKKGPKRRQKKTRSPVNGTPHKTTHIHDPAAKFFTSADNTQMPSTTTFLSTCPRVKVSFGCHHAYLSPAGPNCPGMAHLPDHARCAPMPATFEQECADCIICETQMKLWEDDYAFGIAYHEVPSSCDSSKELQTWTDVVAEHEARIATAHRDQPDISGWESVSN